MSEWEGCTGGSALWGSTGGQSRQRVIKHGESHMTQHGSTQDLGHRGKEEEDRHFTAGLWQE